MSFDSQIVLAEVGFDLQPATVTVLFGENGSGKTTLINHLLGLLKPDRGTVSIFGMPAGSHGARQRLGAMHQDAECPSLLTVRELVTLFRKGYDDPMDERELLRVTRLEQISRKRYGTLSGGERRRVQCALALCGNLLLDEPTAHMDAASKEVFWNAVAGMRNKGCCVLMVSHQRDEIQALADAVLQLSHGRISSHASVDDASTGVRMSRVSFVSRGGQRESLLGMIQVRELRQVGRMTEAIVTDVPEFIGELKRLGVDTAGIAVSPVVSDLVTPSTTTEDKQEGVR